MSKTRIKKLQALLKENNLDAFVITDPTHLYYFTGLDFSTALFVVTLRSHTLFVNELFLPECNDTLWANPKKMTSGAYSKLKGNVGFTSSEMSFDQHQRLSDAISGKLIPSTLATTMRIYKEKRELEALHASAKLVYSGFAYIKAWVQAGMSEIEVANEFERFVKEKGADKVSFDPIIASGIGGAIPHYKPSKTLIGKNDPLLIDIGVMLNGYASDMTRVIRLNNAMKPLYAIIQEAHNEAVKACHVGAKLKDVDKAARQVLKFYGYEKEFIHSLGHGIGLCVHEAPFFRKGWGLETELSQGMVFTIEPGIYIKGVGGVRYENMVEMGKSRGVLLMPND